MNRANRNEFQSRGAVKQLISQIYERQDQPQDYYEVAAILESMGFNDEMIEKRYGFSDVFDISQYIWKTMREEVHYNLFSGVEIPPLKAMIWEMVRSFLRGLIFAFPMVISVVSMLTLQYSLWSYYNLTMEQATAIAIGTILSFITVGGFTQAIARRGFFYIIQGYFNLAKKSTFVLIGLGFFFSILLTILMLFSNMVFNFFPYKMLLYIMIFYFFLTAIWLSVTVMYILKKEILFTGLFILGIMVVFILFDVVHIGIIASQIIALCIVSICSIFVVLYYFNKEEREAKKQVNLKLPRVSITAYSVAPYFFYGFLYFTFLFIDRVNAWSTNGSYMPFIIWFRGDYELGLDFALLTLIIPMGISEVIVTKLMLDLEASQKQYLARETPRLYQKTLKSYYKMCVSIVFSGIVSAVLIYILSIYYNKVSIYMTDENLLNNRTTQFVLLIGIFSYIVLSVCLMNAVILFAISQPQLVINAILIALLINFMTGFLLSRWVGYQYAVLGLLLGSIYLSIMTTRAVKKVLGKIDYYLYATS